MTSDDDRQDRQAKIAAAAPKKSKARPIAVIVAVLAVLVIGAAVAWGAITNRTPTAAAFPKGATGDSGGIVVDADKVKPGAPTLDIYEDFQCPACKQAEAQLGPEIKKMAEAGEAKVVYHMKDFLDANIESQGQVPNPGSSLRAANAAACAADAGRFQAYHDALYTHQPQEGQGFSNATLEGLAEPAGITGDTLTTWKQCVAKGSYTDYAKRVEEATAKDGVNSTPTYRVNGKAFDLSKVTSAADFRTKVLAAGGSTAAPSPSGSATTAAASPSASK